MRNPVLEKRSFTNDPINIGFTLPAPELLPFLSQYLSFFVLLSISVRKNFILQKELNGRSSLIFLFKFLKVNPKSHSIMNLKPTFLKPIITMCALALICSFSYGQTGVGTEPIKGAKLYLDGSREMLNKHWEYWEGPRFSSEMPIKWPSATDPVSGGNVISSNDPAGAGGKYGAADIVTKDKFEDFRAHVEFLITAEGGNSGVYLQNRYEVQILDGDYGLHGMAALINEHLPTSQEYNGLGKWNAYDIVFRAARFENGELVEQPRATVYFNGVKIHEDKEISQVWGGPNSGLDGGNDGGKGITDRPGGLKLQAEGHQVLYKNIWIKKLKLKDKSTDF